MNKFEELLEKLNELETIQIKMSWSENLPSDIWVNYFDNNFKEVECGLDVDTHRWYETSTSVLKIFDKYLGINFITNLFSESMGCEDCYHTIEFFEMKQIQTISYEAIKNNPK